MISDTLTRENRIDMRSIALCIHNITAGMPIVIKRIDEPAMILDDGVLRSEREIGCYCNELNDLLNIRPIRRYAKAGFYDLIKMRVKRGKYNGIPMYVSTIVDFGGYPVAAIGIIDESGLLSLYENMIMITRINNQLQDMY